jgi:hypothetical protein
MPKKPATQTIGRVAALLVIAVVSVIVMTRMSEGGDDGTVALAANPSRDEQKEFPYDTVTRKGCAGHHPVYANSDTPEGRDIDPTDPEKAGGDPFDLADVALKVARFVRITDLDNGSGDKGTAGFDLDAVAAMHSRPRK